MSNIQDLSIIFLSIFLEAVPFILLGVLLSSIIDEFISAEQFAKIIPKNPILGALVGVVMGFFVPACDCAVIPISKRLIKKGVPMNVAITFMLASPIINPVVLLSTFYAFGTLIPKMILFRTVLGIILSIVIGYRVGKDENPYDLIKGDDFIDCDCCNIRNKNKLVNIIIKANHEFWDVCKYLIIGALIASAMQIYIPREFLFSISQNNVLSIIVLMIFAYLLSLCSTSDSFVAKAFVNQFSNNSILAFLLLGPMIDIKNTIVLLGNYKRNFVFKLIVNIFILIFILALFIKF